MEIYGSLLSIVVLFLVVLGILWIILPFAVFGIKDRLDTLIRQNRQLLERLP